MPNTFGQRFRKKKEGKFTGRREQITIFSNNLKAEEDYIPIFNIYGIGGVGKTTLSKTYKSLVDEANCLSAYTNESIIDLLSWMAAVSKQFKEQKAPLKKFDKRYEDYLQANQKLQADPDRPKGTLRGIIEGLSKGAIKEAKKLPGGDMVGSFINEDTISSSLGAWADFVHKKISQKDDVKLVLNTVEVLSPIFWQDILEHAESFSKVCLFVDTFERTDAYLDDWLLKSLEGTYGDLLPPNLLLTIAGRKPLKETWSTYKDIIHSIRLERFTEEEAMSFLEKNEITDEALQADIIKLSDRLPVLMDWLVFTSKSGSASLNEACDTAVDRFLKWVDDPAKRDIALDVALCRKFNQDTLTALPIKPTEAKPLFDWLRQQPFVIKYDDHWRYHEVVRTQMLTHIRNRSPENWSYKHNGLAHYCDLLQRQLGIHEEKQQINIEWTAFDYEKLYHSLCAQPNKKIGQAIERWAEVFRENGITASTLYVESLKEAGTDSGNELCMKWGSDLSQWIEAFEIGNFTVLQPLIQKILSDNWNLSTDNYSFLYVISGLIFSEIEKYTEAIESYQKAIQIKPNSHEAYYNMGFTYDDIGDKQKAIESYQKAIDIKSDKDGAYNNMGLVYNDLGDKQKAIECYQKAIDINPDKSETYYNMGLIYNDLNDKQKAIECYQKAIDIKPDYDDAYNNMGIIYDDLKDKQKAIECYQKAIDINPDHYYAYNNMGLIYNDLNDKQKAIKYYQKAIDIKPDYHDAYYNMGDSYDDIGDKEKAIECYRKAIEINPNDHEAIHSMGWIYLLTSSFEKAKEYFHQTLKLTNDQHSHAAMNLGHVFLIGERNKKEAIKWYQKSILLRDEKETFFDDMESDFKDLKMEEQDISREEYDQILDTLKTANE